MFSNTLALLANDVASVAVTPSLMALVTAATTSVFVLVSFKPSVMSAFTTAGTVVVVVVVVVVGATVVVVDVVLVVVGATVVVVVDVVEVVVVVLVVVVAGMMTGRT